MVERFIGYIVVMRYLWWVEVKGLDLGNDFIEMYNYVFVKFKDGLVVGSYCDYFENVFSILNRWKVFK